MYVLCVHCAPLCTASLRIVTYVRGCEEELLSVELKVYVLSNTESVIDQVEVFNTYLLGIEDSTDAIDIKNGTPFKIER